MHATSAPRPRVRAARRALLATSVLAATLVPVSSAGAYYDGPAYAFPVPDYVSGLIGQNALSNAYAASGSSSRGTRSRTTRAKPKPKPTPKRATARQLRTLRFVPRPEVTARIHELLVARTGRPAAEIVPLLDGVKADWERVLTKTVRWSARDLGDASAFTFLQLNRLYRGQSRLKASVVAALRTQVRTDLALSAGVRRLPDADKQQAAEMLQLRTVFLASSLEDSRQRGDAAATRTAREDVRRFTREIYGVDLAKVKLTSTGLARR